MSDFVFKEKVDGADILNLPYRSFSGKIITINQLVQMNGMGKHLCAQPFVGFDTETKPAFKKGQKHKVALVQVATASEAFLFRICKMGIPDDLVRLFEDENVLKIGVALRDDLAQLRNLRPFTPKGFVDLQPYVKQFGIQDNGLKKLVANILGFRISKGQQTSNWEEETLTDAQIEYAATDAWVCHEMYRELIQKK